jgi:PmbA protein
VADQLLDLALQVAGRAAAGEELEAYVIRANETEIKVHAGEVESLTVAQAEGVGVRVVRDGRQGYAWAGSLEPAVVADALAAARDNAAFGTPDEHAGIVRPDELGDVEIASLDVFREELAGVSTADKVALTLALEAATSAADPRVRAVESATYGDVVGQSAVATSTGITASSRRTSCSCWTHALAGDGDDTRSGSGFSVGRGFDDLDVEVAAADAARRATRLLGARPIPSRKIPVVLDPLVTRSVLALVGAALSGEAVVKGRSMFAGRLGEIVAAPSLTLVEDPTNPAAFGAAPFDAEGVPTRPVRLVESGSLRRFLHNVSTGRRTGHGSTGSAVRGLTSTPGVGMRALYPAPGSLGPEAILGMAGEALYVQSVSGLHSGANPVSGDFSVGAEGLMVRGGVLAEPVREVTIASTLQRMLQEVVAVGSDLTWLPGGTAGLTMLVDGMSVAGA